MQTYVNMGRDALKYNRYIQNDVFFIFISNQRDPGLL